MSAITSFPPSPCPPLPEGFSLAHQWVEGLFATNWTQLSPLLSENISYYLLNGTQVAAEKGQLKNFVETRVFPYANKLKKVIHPHFGSIDFKCRSVAQSAFVRFWGPNIPYYSSKDITIRYLIQSDIPPKIDCIEEGLFPDYCITQKDKFSRVKNSITSFYHPFFDSSSCSGGYSITARIADARKQQDINLLTTLFDKNSELIYSINGNGTKITGDQKIIDFFKKLFLKEKKEGMVRGLWQWIFSRPNYGPNWFNTVEYFGFINQGEKKIKSSGIESYVLEPGSNSSSMSCNIKQLIINEINYI